MQEKSLLWVLLGLVALQTAGLTYAVFKAWPLLKEAKRAAEQAKKITGAIAGHEDQIGGVVSAAKTIETFWQ